MTARLLINDPIKVTLEDLGLQVTPFKLSPNSAPLGWCFEVNNASFVYRWVDDNEVTIVEYRQSAAQQGMRNPFAEFVWFLNFLSDPKFNLTTISGAVHPLEREENLPRGLGQDRILKYYKFLGGETGGVEWVARKMRLNVEVYRRKNQKRIPPKALPISGKPLAKS
ncbi:hypothetical protein [Terasakiella pusilla]|uniref:hypothetical protein n=1 Tax=Terasakiella pusilla TaxID=64973 RepID=UPI003AA8355C